LDWCFGIGTNLYLNSGILLIAKNVGIPMPIYTEASFGVKRTNISRYGGLFTDDDVIGDEKTTTLKFEVGVIVPYNKYLLFPIGIGMYANDHEITAETTWSNRYHSLYSSWGFTFSAGAMLRIWHIFLIGKYKYDFYNNGYREYRYNWGVSYKVDKGYYGYFEFILGWAKE
jgi:hypothetical protein